MTEADPNNSNQPGQFDARRHVSGLLMAIGQEDGEALTLDDNGMCSFSMGGAVDISIEVPEDLDLLLVYAPIAPLPEDADARHATCLAVLQRNLFQPMLGDGTIGLDPDGGVLIYAVSSEVDGLEVEELTMLLDMAYQIAMEIREMVGFAIPQSSDEPDPPLIIHG